MSDDCSPLAGIHVLDLTWVMVGPLTNRYLADLGAEVVKVESSTRVDPVRTMGPFQRGEVGVNSSVSYHNFNAGKRAIALDLKRPEAWPVVEALLRWADVVVESFAPGVANRLGLTDDAMRAVNPDLVTVSTSIGGPDWGGGVGTMGAAISGATALIGLPGEPPIGPYGPWTDAVAPRYIAASILAALRRRLTTGGGCSIEVAQSEAGIQFMVPALYEHVFNGVTPRPRDPEVPDPWRAPAGMFRAGDDRWVAVDAAAPAAWARWRAIGGRPFEDERFDTIVGRLRHRRALDAVVAAWIAARSSDGVEAQLQAAGVPAHVVSTAEHLGADEDLRTEMILEVADHPQGTIEILGRSFQLTRRAINVDRRGPRVGEHTHEVLSSVCGLDSDEIAALAAAGVLR